LYLLGTVDLNHLSLHKRLNSSCERCNSVGGDEDDGGGRCRAQRRVGVRCREAVDGRAGGRRQ
jgi:hypothetical protein